MSQLQSVRIILVEPAGALNVGAVARLMKNMGLEQLWLVNPQCDPWGEATSMMAVHGQEILQQARQVPDLPTALTGCQRAIATTARTRSQTTILETPRQALPWLIDAPDLTTALIFGPEERGLSNQELNYAQRFVKISTNPDYPSLNLAQAVAICAYELREWSLTRAVTSSYPTESTAIPETMSVSLDALEGFYQHLETLLLKIGYLHPHTVIARMQKLRRLFNQANLSAEQLALLRGILRQMDWATRTHPSDSKSSSQ